MNTLKKINKDWIPKVEMASLAFLLLGLVVSFFLAYFGMIELGYGAGVSIIGFFVLGYLHFHCVFHLIKCPSCNRNMAKFKNGKNIPMKQLYKQLAEGKPCIYCGWNAGDGT
jgi:hypothetical protein